MNQRFSKMGCFVLVLTVLVCVNAFSETVFQPRRLVDAHTAGVLPRAHFDFECRIYPAGTLSSGAGVILGMSVGISERFMLGLSYGGEGWVGRGNKAVANPLPGWLVKYRIFEESRAFPGVAIGYDHQGFGGIAEKEDFGYDGYVFKSPGFFVSLSKNFLIFTKAQIGFHGTVNYSTEESKTVRWPNFLAGMDIGINEELYIVVEYDFGLNQKDPDPPKRALYARPGEGYLNLGIRWAFSPNFNIELDAKDVCENRRSLEGHTLGWGRELKLVYIASF
ncbi:MAG: hypothetical protein Q4F84_04315 [Fibrobacter sp.]|nr:hypothetical protein [Fibrobacter sp.]